MAYTALVCLSLLCDTLSVISLHDFALLRARAAHEPHRNRLLLVDVKDLVVVDMRCFDGMCSFCVLYGLTSLCSQEPHEAGEAQENVLLRFASLCWALLSFPFLYYAVLCLVVTCLASLWSDVAPVY